MKKILFLFANLALVLGVSTNLMAVKPVKNAPTQEEVESVELSDKQTKRMQKLEKRLEKRIKKMEAKADKADVDFDDPVDKWMWFWIFSWGLALAAGFVSLFALSGLFGFISAAFAVFGFIALVLWLVKRFG